MNKEQIEPAIRVAAEQRERFGEPNLLFKGIGSEKTAAALLGMCVKPLDVRAALICAARDPIEMLNILRPIITASDGSIYPCLVEVAQKEIQHRSIPCIRLRKKLNTLDNR